MHEGGILFGAHCFGCHGVTAVAGPLPDLRYFYAEVQHDFLNIVLGGTRQSRGMPSSKDLLNEKQARVIEAYVLSSAEETFHPAAK